MRNLNRKGFKGSSSKKCVILRVLEVVRVRGKEGRPVEWERL